MPIPTKPTTPPEPISDLRKLQLARLERNHNSDYERVIALLSPADKAAVLAYIDALAGKPLPPMPDPGKVNVAPRANPPIVVK